MYNDDPLRLSTHGSTNNDDPLRQPGPHKRSYTPKRWHKPHTRTHTLESDKAVKRAEPPH